MQDVKNGRNSAIELLRIISMIGVVGLHLYGDVKSELTFANTIWEMLYCDIFQMVVPAFVLISGFFSVKYDFRKLSALHIAIVIYSIIELFVNYMFTGNVGVRDVIKAFFPIMSYRYWFFSCYFLLVIFSGIINWIADNLPRKMFRDGLLLWIFFVSLLSFFPEFGFVDDGLWVMLFYYFAGRYLKKYGLDIFKNDKTYLFAGIGLMLAGFMMNTVMALVLRKGITWFADYAFALNEIANIFLFYYVTCRSFSYKPINYIASFAPIVYLAEGIVRAAFMQWFNLSFFYDKFYFFFLVLLMSMVIAIIVIAFELCRRLLFSRWETAYTLKLQSIFLRFMDGLKTFENKL